MEKTGKIMNKIGIIITTFMRDELLFKSIASLEKNRLDNFELIVIDQGICTEENHEKWRPSGYHYFSVPYDSGLSYCRNYGVLRAKELGCDYCLIASDSFLFNESIKKINKLANILEDTDYDLIGFELSGCVCDWEAELKLIEGQDFELDFIDKNKNICLKFLTKATQSSEWKNEDGSPALIGDVINMWNCDIMRNIFIAKTETLLDVKWDDYLKLGEHEDFFWRYKQTGHRCGWTDYIDAEKMTDRPDEYANMRRKNFNEGLAYLRKKYSMTGWVSYKNLDRAKRSK